MPKYFSKLTVCISCFSVVSKNQDFYFFYPKILSCVEINLLEFRSQVKNLHVSEVWVNFTTQLGLFIKIWAGEHFLHMCPRTIALKYEFPAVTRLMLYVNSKGI